MAVSRIQAVRAGEERTMRRQLRIPGGVRDPGRERLITAIAVSSGVVGSALIAVAFECMVHSDPGFLAMAVFLSVQAGVVVKDGTPSARAITSLLLVPAVLLSAIAAALLSLSRPTEIVVFVALAGAAIWIRRYGARAGAIGTLAFLTYFFTLFMRPTVQELPAYCAIAVVAASAQTIARAVLELARNPRREIARLLRELRISSAVALDIADALGEGPARSLDAQLARVDAVAHAISHWQEHFRTEVYVGCSDERLSLAVADACASLDALCDELVCASRRADANVRVLLDELKGVIGRRGFRAAAGAPVPIPAAQPPPIDRVVYLIRQCERAYLRVGVMAAGVGSATRSARPGRPSSRSQLPVPFETAEADRSGRGWRAWNATSRLAVQAMIAATIAAAAGEAISATRWYWAVMTAFVIFLSTTTRGGVLTRAYRRVTGSAMGIACGVAAVSLSGVLLGQNQQAGLVVICTIGVFGMLYWGPESYSYSAFFTTVMLVAIYAMLGVLAPGLLELRLDETILGAVVGVLCAYLILSASSRPALTAKIDAYFTALQQLIRSGASVLDSPGSRRENERAVEAAAHVLRDTASDVGATAKAMSAAFLNGRVRREADALVLMQRATRAAIEFAHGVMISVRDVPPGSAASARRELHAAADRVCESAESARGVIEGTAAPTRGTNRPSGVPAASNSGRPVGLALAFEQIERVERTMSRLILVVDARKRD